MSRHRSALAVFLAFAFVSAGTAQVPPALGPAAQPHYDRGLAARERSDWSAAIEAFEAARQASPPSAPILSQLGQSHLSAGNYLAAIAWLRAALAVEPGVQNPEPAQTIAVLHSLTRARLERLYKEAREVREALIREDLEPGGIREYARLAAQAQLAQDQIGGARAAMAAVDVAANRDADWAGLVTVFLARADDFERARLAAESIEGAAARSSALAQVNAAGAKAGSGAAGLSPLEHWIDLAQFLSRRDHVVRLEAILKKATEARVVEVPIRLLEIATALSSDYLRIQRLEAKTGVAPTPPERK